MGWLSKLWATFRDNEKEATIVVGILAGMFALTYLVSYLLIAFISWDFAWIARTSPGGRFCFVIVPPILVGFFNLLTGRFI